jgi:hypothetical protein
VTGKPAFARVGGITLFNEALMWGLRGGIAAAPEHGLSTQWHVSVLELIKRLQPRVKALAQAENAEQTVDPTGRLNDAVLHEFAATPKCDLRVDLLPAAATAGSLGSLRHGQRGMIVDNVSDWPLVRQVDAGIYEIKIDTPDPFADFSDFLNLEPPAQNPQINVEP